MVVVVSSTVVVVEVSAILMNMVAFAVLLKIDYENRILMRGGKL